MRNLHCSMRNLVPWPGPLYWEGRVLATGPPGKSLPYALISNAVDPKQQKWFHVERPLNVPGLTLTSKQHRIISNMQETWVQSLGWEDPLIYPLQYSGLENSMDSIVPGMAESDTTAIFTLSIPSLHCFLRKRHWGQFSISPHRLPKNKKIIKMCCVSSIFLSLWVQVWHFR